MNYKNNFKKNAYKKFQDPIIDLINLLEKEVGITPYMEWLREERVKAYIVSPLPQYFVE